MLGNFQRLLARRVMPSSLGNIVPAQPEVVPASASASEPAEPGLADAVAELEQDVAAAMRRLSGGLSHAHDASSHAEACARDIHNRVGAVREATLTASTNSAALACATQQVSDAAEQVGVTICNARDRLDQAAIRATEATEMMTGLAAASVEIRSIVDSIAEIARQTNLLALNATIEAARAGDAGRGFAVVAKEVKELSVEVRNAVDHIRHRVDNLAQTAQGSAAIVTEALAMVRDVNPVMATIGAASQEQAAAAIELSRSAEETAGFMDMLMQRVNEIDQVALESARESLAARTALAEGATQADSLLRRFVPTLRHAAFADRREHDRYPAEHKATLAIGNQDIVTHTVDVGLGGALLARPSGPLPPAGSKGRLTIADLPPFGCRLAAISELGLHVSFDAGQASTQLEELLTEIRRGYGPLIERAQGFAREVEALMSKALRDRRLSEAALFDIDYRPVEGTDPQQFTNLALPVLDQILPPLYARVMAEDTRLIFALAIDRNGYIPVHNKGFNQPQRPGEPLWNAAHCRNRRIFDDRAGIMAARSVRPFLVQSYLRDMGGGVTQLMREVDAPLRIGGRHWGGVRMAYSM